MQNTNNHTNNSSERPYENDPIPIWGFNSSCHWHIAEQVDLAMCSVAIFYNLIMTLLPLFISRMYCMQGSVISSFTVGAFLVSMYNAFFDIRLLASSKQQLENEGFVLYLLIWFLSYHFLFHMHLLSWDQHHSITQFKAHRRFMSRSKLVKIILVVWICAGVFALVEAIFVYNPLHYPEAEQTDLLSHFRLIILLTTMGFFWFGPLVLIVSWNASVFTFLLKVTQNGYETKTPPERAEQIIPDDLPEFVPDPWNTRRDDEMYYEDPPEYATLPDDVKNQLSQSFANFVAVTTSATLMVLWFSYHICAMLRTGKVLPEFYKIIYNCEFYISLYTVIKFLLLLNPLWWFYYGTEMRMCSVRKFGVPHHQE